MFRSMQSFALISLALLLAWVLPVRASTPGLIIPNKNGTWYSLKASNPVVLQFGPHDYRMWAYGREVGYNGSPVVSFGRSGYFISNDGINWTPVAGPGPLGSVMSGNKTCGDSCFDSGDVGVTDVLYSPNQKVFYMWYMGTRQPPNSDLPAFGLIPAARGGIAVSYDGVHWSKCKGPAAYGSFLEATPGIDAYMFLMTLHPHSVGPDGRPARSEPGYQWRKLPPLNGNGECTSRPWSVDEYGVNASSAASVSSGNRGGAGGKCAGVVPDCAKLMRQASKAQKPCGKGNSKQQPCAFSMFYNSISPVNGSTTQPVPPSQLVLQLFGASGNSIFNLTKTGAVASLGPNTGNPLAPDSASTGSARVLALPGKDAGYLLFYEGVSKTSQRYSILLARSKDGQTWVKDAKCTGFPGGPVLLPGQEDSAWDYFIGTPFPLLQPDGKIFLYYVGFVKPASSGLEGGVRSQIGLAIGHISNPCKFEKYVAS